MRGDRITLISLSRADRLQEPVLSWAVPDNPYSRFMNSTLLTPILLSTALFAQSGLESDLRRAYLGKPVVLKVDMPATQKGVDLRFDKGEPMNWREYSDRIKEFGVALRKGDRPTVTALVVKKNMVELQLNGGGFGTVDDISRTTVQPLPVERSGLERRLERDLAREDDPERRERLKRDLERERRSRQREEERRRADARDQTLQRQRELRATGGSRFNLRWDSRLPEDLSPQAFASLLREFIETEGGYAPVPPPAPPTTSGTLRERPAPPAADVSIVRRGATIDEIQRAFGPGKLVSESATGDMKTQQISYLTQDHQISVTYVDGLVVRYSINPR